jgi:arabinofuranosyltransferase
MLPIVVILIMGWQHRWIADDGFINFRYVDQIRHGNGPVFNAGERVEAFTSPAWLALLFGVDLVLPLRIEWIAVVSGLALTAAGFAFAAAGSARLWRRVAGEGPCFPAGLLVFAALPPAWDFATSGLDGALAVAWLGASWWALCRRVLPEAVQNDPRTKASWWSCVLIGLGPLVRPELGLMTVVFLGVLLVAERSWPARARVVVWALALPAVYELFRMAYYAALVSNSALAKEAGTSEWSRGWNYLVDFVEPYFLWIPLAFLVPLGFIPLVRWARTRPSWLHVTLIAAPVAAGLAEAAYVIRVGGDFMHARMLLPALFSLLLPVGVVVVRSWRWAAALLLVPWILITAVAMRRDGSELDAAERNLVFTGIVNERDVYVRFSGQQHPVTIDDYLRAAPPLDWATVGREARRRAARGEGGLVLVAQPDLLEPLDGAEQPLPLNGQVETPIVSAVAALGLYGYAAGPHVFVVDSLGLSTALGSHFRRPHDVRRFGPTSERAGHDKPHRSLWEVARFTPAAPGEARGLRDARDALTCGELPELLEAVTDKFGPRRAAQNLLDSLTLTGFRLPEDPPTAAHELCCESPSR